MRSRELNTNEMSIQSLLENKFIFIRSKLVTKNICVISLMLTTFGRASQCWLKFLT